MDERKRSVLQAIIEEYILFADPVGSRTISRKYLAGISAATIRNEMSDLEESGYLEQPHTSAGRIPSDKGYRFYVDDLMTQAVVAPDEKERIRIALGRQANQMEWVLQEAVRLLSQSTPYTSVMMSWREPAKRNRLQSLQAIPVGGARLLLVLVTNQEHVQYRMVDLPEEFRVEEIISLVAATSEAMRGKDLGDITYDLLDTIFGLSRNQRQVLLAEILQLLQEGRQHLQTSYERVFISGIANILRQPEFRDHDRISDLFTFFENEQELAGLFPNRVGRDPQVKIGGENIQVEVHDCSVATAQIKLDTNTSVRVAIVGPKRMQYARVFSLMNEVGSYLSHTR